MKPPPFAYADPESVGEVLELLAEYGDDAAVLAGGQSLVPDLNFRRRRPAIVIDLRRVSGLGGIVTDSELVRAGASCLITTLAASHGARAMAEAVGCVGHPQIRSRTTVGGTIALGEPAAELPAVFVGLDGVVTLASVHGERIVEAADFFVGPRSTTRRPDELITSVAVGVPAGDSTWLEVARRPNDLPIVGMMVACDGASWRVAYSGVAPTPVRALRCEDALRSGDVEAAVAGLVAELDPPTDHLASADHRRSIAASLLRRAVPRLSIAEAGVTTTPAGATRSTAFELNGVPVAVEVQPRTLLTDTVRHVIGRHGTHVGCEQGACGACTVLVGGVARRACLTLTPQVDGGSVETIESVAGPAGLDPLQQAIHDLHGLQCGYCTPGIVMSLVGARRAGATCDEATREVLNGHLCRCTGYVNLRAAIAAAWSELPA